MKRLLSPTAKSALLLTSILLFSCHQHRVKEAHAESNQEALTAITESDAVPIVMLPPRYPREAVTAGIEGLVCFNITIKKDGSVGTMKIYHSRPEGIFDFEASSALQRWKFKPKFVNGAPVEQENAKYCLEFKLPPK